MIALVAAGTLNSSAANLRTAVKGAPSGTEKTRKGSLGSDVKMTLKVTLAPEGAALRRGRSIRAAAVSGGGGAAAATRGGRGGARAGSHGAGGSGDSRGGLAEAAAARVCLGDVFLLWWGSCGNKRSTGVARRRQETNFALVAQLREGLLPRDAMSAADAAADAAATSVIGCKANATSCTALRASFLSATSIR
jgi:hypothetical protein